MNIRQKEKAVPFAELIENGYRGCGKRRTRGIFRLAAKARLIVFQGRGRLIVF